MFNLFSSKEEKIIVAVATQHGGALQALENVERDLPLERREALSTQGLYDHLPGAHLVIVDLDDLREFGISRTRLAEALNQSDVVGISGGAFTAEPERYLNQARTASGLTGTLPARSVAFASLSGGVGKTTLSLSLARTFRQQTGLPATVIELTYGPSGLLALTGQEGSHLFEVVTQDQEWPTWQEITLAPMDWDTTQLLNSREDGRKKLEGAWRALKERHVLTIFDAPIYHQHWSIARDLAESVFVVTDDRPDALAAAVSIIERNQDQGYEIALNRGGMAGRMALEKVPAVRIPDVGDRARNFPSNVGQKVMSTIYPGWKS